MVYTPPTFKNFGKDVKDLLGKGYDLGKYSLSNKQKTESGVTLESGVGQKRKDGSYNGYLKSKFNVNSVGALEVQLGNASNATLTTEPLVDGLVLKIKGDGNVNAGISAEYTNSSIKVTADTKTALLPGYATSLDVSAAFGIDGFALGGAASVNANTQDVTDYNAGAQYVYGDYTVAVRTAQKMNDLKFSTYWNCCKDFKLGAQLGVGLGGTSHMNATVGVKKNLDSASSVQAKVQWPSTDVTFALEHKLTNPSVKFGFASTFNAAENTAAKDFGLTATFGNY